MSPSDEFPERGAALYFAGMWMHAGILWVRRRWGKRAALSLIKCGRIVAKRYSQGEAGFSVRPGEGMETLLSEARPSALLMLAILDEVEREVRAPKA